MGYVYAELSLINKAYDSEDWDATVELKCFKADKRSKEICHLILQRKISSTSPVVYIGEGWENKKVGLFWKSGAYLWEAWVDGQKVGSRYFYVQSAGQRPVDIPDDYLELVSVKLYEASVEDQLEEERTYLIGSDHAETRYIYLELELANLVPDASWHLELITRFFNESRELKGQATRLMKISPEQSAIRLSVGWLCYKGVMVRDRHCRTDFYGSVGRYSAYPVWTGKRSRFSAGLGCPDRRKPGFLGKTATKRGGIGRGVESTRSTGWS